MAYTVANAFELIAECHKLAEDTGDLAIAKQSELGGLSTMFLARAGQSAYSAGLLAQHGLNGDAMSVARTVIEMSIDYAYIAKDPAVRIPKFVEYDHVSKFRIVKAVDKLHGGTLPREAMRTLEQRHDAARQNNPESDYNWAGVSIRKRAIEVDRLLTWELPYADMCTASHSCYGTLEYALVGLGEDAEIHFGRMAPNVKPADLAFVGMLMLIGDVIQACDLEAIIGERLKLIGAKRQAYTGT